MIEVGNLKQSSSGQITGTISVRFAEGLSFPEADWSDFPVVLLGSWIEALLGLESGRKPDCKLLFMDGPMFIAVDMPHGATEAILRTSISDRPHRSVCVRVNFAALQSAVLSAARTVLDECDQREFRNRDVKFLRQLVDASSPRGDD